MGATFLDVVAVFLVTVTVACLEALVVGTGGGDFLEAVATLLATVAAFFLEVAHLLEESTNELQAPLSLFPFFFSNDLRYSTVCQDSRKVARVPFFAKQIAHEDLSSISW